MQSRKFSKDLGSTEKETMCRELIEPAKSSTGHSVFRAGVDPLKRDAVIVMCYYVASRVLMQKPSTNVSEHTSLCTRCQSGMCEHAGFSRVLRIQKRWLPDRCIAQDLAQSLYSNSHAVVQVGTGGFLTFCQRPIPRPPCLTGSCRRDPWSQLRQDPGGGGGGNPLRSGVWRGVLL